MDKELPSDDERAGCNGVRQEPPVSAESGGGGDSEAFGGTVLMVPPFFLKLFQLLFISD